MARFNRYDYRWDNHGNRRSEEELDRMEEEFNYNQKLKNKKRMKAILSGVVGFFLLVTLFFSCERIDAGHVGVKVNLYGDNKGVSDVTEVTGMVFFNPLTHNIYEFPTFVQHKNILAITHLLLTLKMVVSSMCHQLLTTQLNVKKFQQSFQSIVEAWSK